MCELGAPQQALARRPAEGADHVHRITSIGQTDEQPSAYFFFLSSASRSSTARRRV